MKLKNTNSEFEFMSNGYQLLISCMNFPLEQLLTLNFAENVQMKCKGCLLLTGIRLEELNDKKHAVIRDTWQKAKQNIKIGITSAFHSSRKTYLSITVEMKLSNAARFKSTEKDVRSTSQAEVCKKNIGLIHNPLLIG